MRAEIMKSLDSSGRLAGSVEANTGRLVNLEHREQRTCVF
jgi:hypothetical protein